MDSPFLASIKEQMWLKRYAKRTIENYLYWVKTYILFHQKRHPLDMHNAEVTDFEFLI